MQVNVWLSIRDDAHASVGADKRFTEGEGRGRIHDRANTQRLFRVDTRGGRQWTLWSIYFDETSDVEEELDQLVAEFPGQIQIVGAWNWDGTQLPEHPPHQQLLRVMPDQAGVPAIVPVQVNLLYGQSPRQF